MMVGWLPYLAQIDGVFAPSGGEASALGSVQGSIELSRATVESWEQVWLTALDPLDGSLWYGLCQIGLALGGLSILYLAVRDGGEIIKKQSWADLAALFVWPLVVVVFLKGNGQLLSDTVKAIRGYGYLQTQRVLEFQLGELTFRDALTRQGLSSATQEALRNLYSECQGKVGEELVTCWEEKRPRAEQIVAAAEQQAGTGLPQVRGFLQALTTAYSATTGSLTISALANPGGFLRDNIVPIVRAMLYGLQWMVVNLLEAALLLTALFSPIALGLSLLPFQGRPILAWLVGFISLFGVQLGYNIVVGLVASRIVESGGELATDVGFAMLLSFGAPAISLLISTGGGVAVYRGLSSNLQQMTDFLRSVTSSTTLTVLRMSRR
jgi:hypothetical protein